MTGEQLYAELVAAAGQSGASVRAFAAPLFKGASWKLEQLRIARNPTPVTVARVRALIAGEPLPPTREKRESVHQAAGVTRLNGELVPSQALIESQRAIAEAAHVERRPGETLHDAVRRLSQQLAA